MGIKNLHQFLKKVCPNAYKTIPISKYAFKKIAIDISIFMCKYKNATGNNFMDPFLNLISTLRYNDVHFVFVYDSKAPPEKDKERKSRYEAREKNKVKVENMQQAWFKYKECFPEEKEVDIEKIQEEGLKNFIQKISELNLDCEYQKVAVSRIDLEICKLQNTLINVRTEDFNLTKEFFRACEIPILDAIGEAEATCSALVKQGFVTAVLTEDTDVLAYGVNYMLHKMDVNENTFCEIDYEEILQKLKLTSEQFLDFCILCGTDYNTNLFKIGPEKAYKYIIQYETIENIAKETNHDISVLNHEKVRSLFTTNISFPFSSIPYCGFPKKQELEHLYFVHNCKYNLNKMYQSFHISIFHEFELQQNDITTSENKEKKNYLLLT